MHAVRIAPSALWTHACWLVVLLEKKCTGRHGQKGAPNQILYPNRVEVLIKRTVQGLVLVLRPKATYGMNRELGFSV